MNNSRLPVSLAAPVWLSILLCLLSLACEPTLPADALPPEEARAALAEVHAAYLARDYPNLARRSRALLETPQLAAGTLHNALAVLDRAQEVTRGKLPADWRMPEPLRDVRVQLLRIESPDGTVFQLLVGGSSPAEDTVRQVSVTDAAGHALLDRRAGVGEWQAEPEEGRYYWELEGPELSAAPAEGYYALRFELADGRQTVGWFPMSRLRASESPRIVAPAPEQVVASPTPELMWDDFRSPEYRPFEARSTGLWVTRIDPSATPRWRRAWSVWRPDAQLTRAVVGAEPGGSPQGELPPGDYWLSVTYGERWFFGELQLIRASRTSRPFRVAAKG